MNIRMISKKMSEYGFFLSLGGCLYYGIEILYRGFSHWTMFLDGGVVFLFCAWQGNKMKWKEPIWISVLRGTMLTLSMEFVTGIIFNKWLKKEIWDYSDLPYHLWGQICLPFALLFAGLLFPAVGLSRILAHYLYKEE